MFNVISQVSYLLKSLPIEIDAECFESFLNLENLNSFLSNANELKFSICAKVWNNFLLNQHLITSSRRKPQKFFLEQKQNASVKVSDGRN